MRLLHIADVHLGAPFRWLGSKGHEQRRQLRTTFRTTIDLALSERVDALLVAGDLFDSNAPSQDDVDLVCSQFARLSIPIVILPGTHDCLDPHSIYRKVDFGSNAAASIFLFDESQTAFELGSLTVHGNANLTKSSTDSPLRNIVASGATRFNVALAHGSLAMPGTEADFPITTTEIAGSGMQYIALGHWHSYQDCSVGSTKVCYAGPPEMLGYGEAGSALLIELNADGVVVEQRKVGRRGAAKITVPLDGISTMEVVRAQLQAMHDEDLALFVTLAGLRPLNLIVDIDKLHQDSAAAFFGLHIDDRSHPVLSPDDVAALPEKTVIGHFARRMTALVSETTDPEEKPLREAALQLGLALLQGRKVLA